MTWNTNTAILSRLETFSEATAWTSLVEHFEQPLSRYARRSGLSHEAVQDVVQETLVAFATAYQRGTYDRTRGRLSSWLFGIARREVASARRKAALVPVKRSDFAHEDQHPDSDEDALECIWQEEWRRSITQRCIERVRREIEPQTWQCFDLQVFQGLDAKAVSALLNLPRDRVYDAKYRVSRRLRLLASEYEDA